MTKNHDWPKKKGMPIRCRVYIPSTQGMSNKISNAEHQKRAQQVKKKMISFFGGSTQIKSKGSWFESGTTVNEPVLLVESYTTRAKWNKNDKKMKRYLNKKKKQWGQEVLSMEYEDLSKNLKFEGMHFI